MSKTTRTYPAPSELDSKGQELAKLESAKATMEEMGINASPELLEKINQVSGQTREKLPKWVTDPKWIDQLEDLRTRLMQAKKIFEGGNKKHFESQLSAIQYQLDKVENVLNQPKVYLPEGMSRKEYAQKISGTTETKRKEKELSPEERETLFNKLETRFKANMQLHQGVNWAEVKASLLSNPDALKSLALMESAGHEPDVYYSDNNDYYFGTCSQESPPSGRNLDYPQAVAQAKTIGVTLMLPDHYKYKLQNNGIFDTNSWSWLLTQEESLSTGNALFGRRYGGSVYVVPNVANFHDVSGAWRGSLRVKKS